MIKNRREIGVKNNPGIYKQFKLNPKSQKWEDSGRYRAIRRIAVSGIKKKEQAFFNNIEDARAFRIGKLAKTSRGTLASPTDIFKQNEKYLFGELVRDWQAFHYLTLEFGTKQTYDKLLPHLRFLDAFDVSKIDSSAVDELVKHWVHPAYPKCGRRASFEKELDLLKTILNFYRIRKNPSFPMPVLMSHYAASDIAKKAKKPVQSLTLVQLGRFLESLKTGPDAEYYPLAVTQFCLGLRIGEACGLTWDAVDFENLVVRIESVIIWDLWNWTPMFKGRPKNKKVRYLPLPENLAKMLWELKQSRDPKVALLFHHDGQPFLRNHITKAYNYALRSVGAAHVSGTHVLRKTFATLVNDASGHFYAVSKALGHSKPEITERYIENSSVQQKKVATAVDSLMNAIDTQDRRDNIVAGQSRRPLVPHCPASGEAIRLKLIKSIS
ncbi:MAG: site-specific integrase [Deltaproteobacteria bacterium]|nr:site-specific integrase [Deltaproteobacteria bacterium]